MILFLTIVTAVLLVICIFSLITTIKVTPRRVFSDLDVIGMSNGAAQFGYFIGGLYILYILTVMTHVRALTAFGIVVSLESLLLVLYIALGFKQEGLLSRYFRGFGLYVSTLLHMSFFIAALYLLIRSF